MFFKRTRKVFSFLAIAAVTVLFTNCSNPLNEPAKKTTGNGDSLVVVVPDTNATFNPTHQPTTADSTRAAAIADSAYDELDSLIRTVRSIKTYDEWVSKDFVRVRDRFEAALNLNPANIKANLGYTVASTMALNTSATLQKMVDSLRNWDSLSTHYENGVAGVAKVLLVEALAQAAPGTAPKFPRFVSVSYVQTLAANELLPVLSNAIAALKRIEAQSNPSYTIVVDGDSAKIDKGEILLLDASLRFIRASIDIFCMYDHDWYSAPGVKDMATSIDLIRSANNTYIDRHYQKVSADTLYNISYNGDSTYDMIFGRIMKNSLQPGTDYLKLRGNFNVLAKNDFLAIPVILKSALASFRDASGEQSLDIIKSSDIADLDSSFAQFSRDDAVKAGLSAALRNKFATPESFLDFVTELLSGPYTINEKVGINNGADSVQLNLAINLAAWLNTPVQDLKTLLPKFRWLPESEWFKWEMQTNLWSNWPTNEVCVNLNYDSLYVPPSRIATTLQQGGMTCYVLTDSIRYNVGIYSNYNFMCFQLVNDAGADIDNPDSSLTTFPYLPDYTIGGLFPGMATRQSWLSMINSFLPDSTKLN